MEKKIMMPANYNVMSEEEMTYTQGGNAVDAAFSAVVSLSSLAVSVLYIYNYAKGMKATREYIKAHKGEDTSTLVDGGIEVYSNYVQSSPVNAIKDIAAGLASMSFFPITALCVVTA